ncbi:hypothetical protein HZB06_02225 [Candidatus Wolfebacteria bacterium]|nr:hypothetical protein [Candidatus Wolfebacteria bacterium]
MNKESKPTQDLVDVEDIKDGTIILKNGSVCRVLMVSGVNLELKSEEEQNAVIFAYQNFLNSLDFSVQFLIHSRKLNIEGYIEAVSRRRESETNELLKNQISEYTEFVRSFVESNAIMSKNFFAIVPYYPIMTPKSGKTLFNFLKFGEQITSSVSADQTLEQKMVQLNQRADQVISGLNQIGLRTVALNDEELTEFFYNLYNPETVEKKELKIATSE